MIEGAGSVGYAKTDKPLARVENLPTPRHFTTRRQTTSASATHGSAFAERPTRVAGLGKTLKCLCRSEVGQRFTSSAPSAAGSMTTKG